MVGESRPSPPPRLRPLDTRGRERIFGRFRYQPKPTPTNREAIVLLDDWARENLVRVRLPILGGVTTRLHVLAAPRLLALIEAWREAGVLEDIVSFDGAYAARLVRGTKLGTLSAHAWGTAIDLNARFNPLGALPVPLGRRGSVLRLVPLAEAHGWYWGGRFSRSDPQHFELCQL